MKDETEVALAAALGHFTERLGWLSASRPSDETAALEKIRLMLHEWDSTVAPAISQIRDPQIVSGSPGTSGLELRFDGDSYAAFC